MYAGSFASRSGNQSKGDGNMTLGVISEPTENMNSSYSSESQIIEDIVPKLKSIIDQIHMNFANARKLILELARRFNENKIYEQSQICRKIKEILKDKIKEGKITEKWIEECLPQEYKRKYTKSEVSSLSRKVKKNSKSRTR
jgi:hypothetical protein